MFASTFLYGVVRRDGGEHDRHRSAPYVNVLDPEFYVDPWDAYRWLRDEAPCFWDPVQQLWVVSRYDDVMTIEKQRRALLVVLGVAAAHRPARRPLDDQHGRPGAPAAAQRSSSRQFNPGAVRSHEDHVRELVTEILDAVVPLGECEAVEAIASRLPAIMIGDLLGYPREHVGAGAALVGAAP